MSVVFPKAFENHANTASYAVAKQSSGNRRALVERRAEFLFDFGAGFFFAFAAVEDGAEVADVGVGEMFLGGDELLLLFLADVVQVFFLQLVEALQPAGAGYVARGEVGEEIVDLLVLCDGVTGVVSRCGIAQHA